MQINTRNIIIKRNTKTTRILPFSGAHFILKNMHNTWPKTFFPVPFSMPNNISFKTRCIKYWWKRNFLTNNQNINIILTPFFCNLKNLFWTGSSGMLTRGASLHSNYSYPGLQTHVGRYLTFNSITKILKGSVREKWKGV